MNIEYKGQTATIDLDELKSFIDNLGLHWRQLSNDLLVWGENEVLDFKLNNKNGGKSPRFSLVDNIICGL